MSKETEKMTARTLIALLAAGACLLLAAPSALAAVPALKLTATPQPTNFVAGAEPVPSTSLAVPLPQYSVIATNTGLVSTSGPIVLSVTLPPQLTSSMAPTPPVATDPNTPVNNAYSELVCTVSGQTATCTDPHSLRPGQWVQMIVPVKVDAGASGTLSSQVSVQGGGAAEARTAVTTQVSEELPSFDFLPGPSGFSLAATAPDGQPATQAGSHPSQLTFDLGFPSRQILEGTAGAQLAPAVPPKDLRVTLPRGMVTDPRATPARCTEAQLNNEQGAGCPVESQVGVIFAATEFGGYFPFESPLYNMVPPPGAAAEFAFNAIQVGIFVHLLGRVNSAGEYELGADTPNILARSLSPVLGAEVQFWGDPSDPSHDRLRGSTCGGFGIECSIAVKRLEAPLLTMPSSCRAALSAAASVDSWEAPATKVSRSASVEDPADGAATPTDGCNQLDFAPTLEAKPTTNLADAPSGLEVDLNVPQTSKLDELATANFKDVKVTLPEGMAVNPSSADGQGVCSPAQIGLSTPVGQASAHFTEAPGACPEAAKIGSLQATTPLLDHPLKGSVYLAKPFDNPFGSLLAIYFDIEDPLTGVISKLAGRVQADPQSGRLSTTFSENPELPVEDVKLSLFKGPRAPLRTPSVCATHTISSEITPWSTPEGIDAHPADSFATSVAASGSGPCPTSEASVPNSPSFSAGTIAPQAGAYSPFVLKLSRPDGTQALAGIEATLPKGLIGKLAGISYCPEAAIARATARNKPEEGAIEQAHPSCPANSEVGTVDAAAGAGIIPIHAGGHAYLAGPYKGAPLSLVVITPAVAGPFDLGAVVVRNALRIDPETAQVRAVSDPFPRILDGIPLDLRSVEVKLGRPDFTLNPTNCTPMSITASATSALGSLAPLSSPFQVGGCQALPYKPKLAIRFTGPTTRGGHPTLKATFTAKPGEAGTARLSLALPHSEFIDQAQFRTICTRVQFAADQCPAGSIYGQVKATTPLLDYPLEGSVYLRSSSHKLPDVVLALKGPPSQPLEVDLAGKVDSVNGGLRTTFESLPDAPITKATVSMQGGKKGLFQNSTNICRAGARTTLRLDGQNGKTSDSRPAISIAGCKGKAHKNHKKGSKGKARR